MYGIPLEQLEESSGYQLPDAAALQQRVAELARQGGASPPIGKAAG
jgi:hypothetical protein